MCRCEDACRFLMELVGPLRPHGHRGRCFLFVGLRNLPAPGDYDMEGDAGDCGWCGTQETDDGDGGPWKLLSPSCCWRFIGGHRTFFGWKFDAYGCWWWRRERAHIFGAPLRPAILAWSLSLVAVEGCLLNAAAWVALTLFRWLTGWSGIGFATSGTKGGEQTAASGFSVARTLRAVQRSLRSDFRKVVEVGPRQSCAWAACFPYSILFLPAQSKRRLWQAALVPSGSRATVARWLQRIPWLRCGGGLWDGSLFPPSGTPTLDGCCPAYLGWRLGLAWACS